MARPKTKLTVLKKKGCNPCLTQEKYLKHEKNDKKVNQIYVFDESWKLTKKGKKFLDKNPQIKKRDLGTPTWVLADGSTKPGIYAGKNFKKLEKENTQIIKSRKKTSTSKSNKNNLNNKNIKNIKSKKKVKNHGRTKKK